MFGSLYFVTLHLFLFFKYNFISLIIEGIVWKEEEFLSDVIMV